MLTILPRPRASMRLPAARQRRNTRGEVHVQHRRPVLVGKIDGGRAPDGAGVVDQDVDRAELARRSRRPAPRRSRRRAGRRRARAARRPSLRISRGGVVGHVLVAVAGDVGAGRGERARERGADSGARAGDERDQPSSENAVRGHGVSPYSGSARYFRLASRPESGAEAGLDVDDAELAIVDLAVRRHHPDEVDAVAGRGDVRVIAGRHQHGVAVAHDRRRTPARPGCV